MAHILYSTMHIMEKTIKKKLFEVKNDMLCCSVILPLYLNRNTKQINQIYF